MKYVVVMSQVWKLSDKDFQELLLKQKEQPDYNIAGRIGSFGKYLGKAYTWEDIEYEASQL